MVKTKRRCVRWLLAITVCAVVAVGSMQQWYIPTKQEFQAYGADLTDIFKGLFRDQGHTAALTPSSPWLVNTIADYVPTQTDVTVLEVGAGPGTITRKIIERMTKRSRLDVVEYSPDLFAALKENLGAEQAASRGRINFYQSAIEEWDPPHSTDQRYDLIISTIPRTQLPLLVVYQILASYERMLKSGGILVSVVLGGSHPFTLATKKVRLGLLTGLSNLMPSYNASAERACRDLAEYRQLIDHISQWEKKVFMPLGADHLVYLNVPPVYVIGLKKRA